MSSNYYYIYPLTIVADRYSGTYSGGSYTAWNLDPWQVPYGIAEDDGTCMKTWWREIPETGIPFGVGKNPDEAIADLWEKIEVANRNKELKEKLLKIYDSKMEWDAIYNFLTDGGENDNS